MVDEKIKRIGALEEKLSYLILIEESMLHKQNLCP